MRSLAPWGILAFLVQLSTCSLPSSEPARPVHFPPDFSPPQVFQNTNLLRTVDITRPYTREVVAAIVENISDAPQSEYYLPFDAEIFGNISYVEARDKKGPTGEFLVQKVNFNSASPTQYYQIKFTEPLLPDSTLTIQITYSLLSTIHPQPSEIEQTGKQFLHLTTSRYFHSSYPTLKQKTKLTFPNAEITEFTVLHPKSDGTDDPVKQGRIITYGPYENVNPALRGGEKVTAMYEHTAPIIVANKLERDIEVSHWGGNIAFEERYTITNHAAKLANNFNRVTWAAVSFYNPPTQAIKALTYDLGAGASDPYYTDEIGNISTSRFRSNQREAHLELKPRFPIFGGWNASFVIGWNHDLGKYLRGRGEEYMLKVPFLEGMKESVRYEEVEVTVILPEGATDVKWKSEAMVEEEEVFYHKTFMDTKGRRALRLKVRNAVDEMHGKEIIVTYRYPKLAILRKPLVVFSGVLVVFVASWAVSKIDTRIV